jgi:hypothetical protein
MDYDYDSKIASFALRYRHHGSIDDMDYFSKDI